MTIKVRMFPHLTELGSGESGITTVIRKYFEHLPEFGIELVDPDATSYDLRVGHAGITGPDVDVAMLHGLYFTSDYNASDWEYRVNSRVIEAIRNAKEITVPSDWVNEVLQRDIRKAAHVIPHGIDWQEWQHKEDNAGYVLWNKNRNADVCDNSVLDVLMKRFPKTNFVSTLLTPQTKEFVNSPMWPENFRILPGGGKTPHAEMRLIVQRAGVYLSVSKETFGIGILEAMASGVPVLGWDWGGNSFLVQHGINGYLAKPNDIDDLCEGLDYCIKHRKTLGDNGRELAKGWTWAAACEKVAGVYQLAMRDDPATVSVVIPVYNKAETLERAVKSAIEQTKNPDRIIIMDDGSNDKSGEIGKRLADSDSRIIYQRIHNSGVAIARNTGIEMVSSKYICCLDADDWIEPTFLEVCVKELEANRSLGIAYTGLMTNNADGSKVVSQWPGEFDPDKQLTYAKKQNQVPTTCVFRRDAWERVGGYKSRYCPMGAGSEDANLWSAITSIGYGAKLATPEPLFNYTAGGGNVFGNSNYQEVDWLSMYPWASDGQHPFASVATPRFMSHKVRQYDEPLVSVIIPVGPGHEQEVTNALDSLEMQTFRKWEAVVVDDTDEAINQAFNQAMVAYPYARFISTYRGKGAGFARNRGVEAARAPLILFLDADDVLASPDALREMIDAWNAEQAVIYSDYLGKAVWDENEARRSMGDKLLAYNPKSQTAVFSKESADFDCEMAQRQPEYQGGSQMPYYHWSLVSVLLPKAWHNEIGGFDEAMETWEDVDYHWRMARWGHCYYRIPKPLILYNYHKGHRREASAVRDENSLQKHKNLVQYITRKEEYQRKAMGCNCGKRKAQANITNMQAATMADEAMVLIEFDFPGSDTRSSYGRALVSPTKQLGPDGRILDYRGHGRRKGDRFLVHIKDQQHRPDLFRIAPAEVVLPEPEKKELPPPAPIVQETAKPKRRRRAKKAA